jgi:two-component system, sensor histidine kinase and response regulator
LFENDIMIVDDNPANLKLLADMLRQQGHEVSSFPLGRLALVAAAKSPPDLFLLDITMPEMDGYEVCERLKSAVALSDIPVIFLSALTATLDKVKGFKAGGVDYISKPFQFEEVHARVKTHLELYHLKRALKMQNERLEEAVTARTHELAEAIQRLTILDRSKNEFLNLISHEFRTPLNGLLGAGELILKGMAPTKGNAELREMFKQSRRRILSILDDALLLTQIDISGEGFKSGQFSLHAVLGRAIENASEFAGSRGVALVPPMDGPELVQGDEDLVARAFLALLETAVKFSARGGTVQLLSEVLRGSIRVTIESQWGTIPNPDLAKFFDILSLGGAVTNGGDLGLGPPVAHRIFSLFGASVTVENRDPAGIWLTVSLMNGATHHGDSRSV